MSTNNCPLCGKELNLDKGPVMPADTLAVLSRHFSEDCDSTARITVRERPHRTPRAEEKER